MGWDERRPPRDDIPSLRRDPAGTMRRASDIRLHYFSLFPITFTTALLILASCVSPCLSEPLAVVPDPFKSSTEGLEKCNQPRTVGSCSTWIAKWYYDSEKEQCDVFQYSGCEGNDNRFASQAECEYHCLPGDHTLPPYMTRSELHNDHVVANQAASDASTTEDPEEIAGGFLELPGSPGERTFTFTRANSFVQIDDIPTFQLRLSRQLNLKFRTKLPHGILAYHGVKDRPADLPPYALYVLVERGQLKVVHVTGENSTSLTMGKGLNRDKWHSVMVRVNLETGVLVAALDGEVETTEIIGLGNGDVAYGVNTDLQSVVSVGGFPEYSGLSPEERLHGVKYIIGSFVGCIKDISLISGEDPAYMEPVTPLVANKHDHVMHGCQDKCRTKHNLCFEGSSCVNHYSHYTCDCFGTPYEGEHCDIYKATVLTMRGYSYMSYRVYDWKDRVHASENRISVVFKTHFDDSTLFYASGESHKHHHLSISIKNHSVVIDLDLGSSPIKVVMSEKYSVTRGHWHNVTVVQKGAKVKFILDHEVIEEEVPGNHHHLYLDPEICLGGGPRPSSRRAGSKNNFVGSLKYAYFNDVNLLYELAKGSARANYVSIFKPDYKDEDVRTLPLTFPFPASHIIWDLSSKHHLNLHFYYKSSKGMAVLASGNVSAPSPGYWELRVVNEEVRFELVPLSSGENETQVVGVTFDPRGAWHRVEITYRDGLLNLDVDYKFTRKQEIGVVEFDNKVMLASSNRRNTGLVGCLREIWVDGVHLEPRSLVRSDRATGQVSLDNCQLVDPCSRPDACKHGGRCAVTNDKVTCDCKDTGYTGKNCHFAEFRRTCEELALLGYTKPDVYLIDIDGNGIFPPAHVKCEFKEDETKTIIEHNLPSQVDVRGRQFGNFKYEIKYREFTPEMLQELISHSLYCTQTIKYDCYKAPLELHTATWFKSSDKTEIIDYLGNVSPGVCPCKENNTCVGGPQTDCNCDSNSNDAKWLSDEGVFTSPKSLGVTEMFFMQQANLDADGQGRITLGPLECVEANTQKYVVTFTSTQSYIEVPGWRSGDLAFSFRTTGERAILLHQPPIRANHPAFTVILANENELLFKFTLGGGSEREMKIMSDRKLNGGDWQKIWIDYNEHHVRFMINTRVEMVDLKPGERFGPFRGSMFVGGVPDELINESEVKDGLVGCFRGLVVNGEILDIYAYISVHLSAIIKDCKPSCDPNPCQNGALCKEGWSTYVCQCQNPWAHLGDHCEQDINQEGLTFRSEDAFIKSVTLASNAALLEKLRKVLSENILINIRTHQKRALILHAYDHWNNFIKLQLDNDLVVFSFNSGNKIEVLRARHEGLSRGQPVQIAIIRGDGSTTLHVEEATDSVVAPLQILSNYTNQPWINPELETLVPQRPLAPPTGYFALSLGGFDPIDFRSQVNPVPGFVGCLRGFRVGEVDYLNLLKSGTREKPEMIVDGCNMKCDEEPCLNQGFCTEDFSKSEAICDCTHTSYTGPTCAEEKGAHFSGHSYLKMMLGDQSPEKSLKVQFAFSTYETNSVILFLKNNLEDSYFLAALDERGKLEIEDQKSNGSNWKADLGTGFSDGSRHSVLYARSEDGKVTLLVDRKLQKLAQSESSSGDDDYEDAAISKRSIPSTEVYLGGFSTNDDIQSDRLVYNNYTGCLSNVAVEVAGEVSRPLEEYMGFSRNKTEKVVPFNPAGVKSGYCAAFAVVEKSTQNLLPTLTNVSMLATDREWKDKAWVEDPPSRIAYNTPYKTKVKEADNTNTILIILASIFVVIVIGCIIELIRNNRAYKRRQRQEDEMWMPPKYTESVLNPPVKIIGFKNHDGIAQNGTELQPLTKHEAINSNHSSPPNGSPPQKKVENTIKNDNSDAELKWEPQGEGAELLGENDEVSDAMIQSLDHLDMEEGDDEVTAEADRSSEEPNSPVASTPVSNHHRPKFTDADSIVLPTRPRRWKPKLSPDTTAVPVFLSEGQRTYGNPVSYLGGPLVKNIQRASKESVLSLD
ncbi:axotactin isoform X2 [Neocloeon triangulifer]|uniref:axotactin isoform X2 n=1 Tax=Neocloeon triangulifer TaxID=2078957 RepID=UPI00286F7BF6|nr:axotactin isoform X2 [Neocloeon triangulifer]